MLINRFYHMDFMSFFGKPFRILSSTATYVYDTGRGGGQVFIYK
ncbi:hypothetical protein ADICYQ_2645 [Cyclobacterium qasimii M12-11B]|uniref:Uncharacterized protein n=1 Tax=Cyclobacterium qasimii M12-11B TaxID=641524 RepID=S7WWG4_9BACT|nr:hypothetical protein ADICYQ_2645 [Cyclobacterium qasimii M12-11B]